MRLAGARIAESFVPIEDIASIEILPDSDKAHIVCSIDGIIKEIKTGLDNFDLVYNDETYLYMSDEDKEAMARTISEHGSPMRRL